MVDASRPCNQLQQQQQQQMVPPSSQLSQQMGVPHLCNHLCCVEHLIGNAFRCKSSGQVRIL
jgi:hypothetical protein